MSKSKEISFELLERYNETVTAELLMAKTTYVMSGEK